MNRRDAIKKTALVMGYAISASTFASVMAGCEAGNSPNWTPVFLTKDQSKLVSAFVDRLIPKTDTPGALDVGVDQFIDVLMGKYMDEKAQLRFVEGLAEVDAASLEAHKKVFSALTGEQQDAIMVTMAKAGSGKAHSFFKEMRNLAFHGYFTSKVIGTEYLNYDPIPGNYDGCIPIEEVGRVKWAL